MSNHIEDFSKYQAMRGFSPRTIDRRRWSLTHLATYVQPLPLEATSVAVLEEFLLRWPSAQSRYSVRSDVRQYFRWAMRRDLAVSDPTDKVDAPRLPVRAATPIRAADVKRALLASTGDLHLMIALAAFAGLRVSEIANLSGRDTDGNRLVVRSGKGGRDRVVPLAPELQHLLADVPAGRLFPGCDGQKVGASIRRLFRRLGIEARPHDLRHSFATRTAERANGNLVLVAQLLGHVSVTTTQRYVRWSPDGALLVAGLYDDAA